MVFGLICRQRSAWAMLAAAAALAGSLSGCTRGLYRRQADRETHYLIREKSLGTPWAVPDSFTIEPDMRSRFFDATHPDFPTLPPAGPRLYEYQLPFSGSGRAAGTAEASSRESRAPALDVPVPGVGDQQAPERFEMLPPEPPALPDAPGQPLPSARRRSHEAVRQVSYLSAAGQDEQPEAQRGVEGADADRQPRTPQAATDPFLDSLDTTFGAGSEVRGLRVEPVNRESWIEIPDAVLSRMLEFASVREEYELTFQAEPDPALIDTAPRLTFDELFKLALMNSREYQRQKELLYEAALNLSLERFAYATKFSVRGNTIDTTYAHVRRDGTTVNSLSVPSSLAGDKLMATGGTLVGQFANDVLLTFNGPNGFAADVSSELLFDITQRVLQRDILLEPLIQSERNVVYAARQFARFRKEFFFTIATAYYNSLLTYRSVEIDAQNYFAQVRNFQQQRKEVISGITSAPNPVALNQFEQGVLRARSTLISQSLRLDETLDRLKLTLGLPTETPINIDLTELDRLTLRDRLEVNREQARRWQLRLEALRDSTIEALQGGDAAAAAQTRGALRAAQAETQGASDDLVSLATNPEDNHADILSTGYSLADRLINWFTQLRKVDATVPEPIGLYRQRAELRLDGARLASLIEREAFRELQTSQPPKQRILVFQRQLDLIATQRELIENQGRYATRIGFDGPSLAHARTAFQELVRQQADLEGDFVKVLSETPEEAQIIALIDRATAILASLDTLIQDLDDDIFGHQVESVELEETLAKTEALLAWADQAFESTAAGLPTIDMSVDDAMITSLVQRLDLMNQRGQLADSWRDIKIAADELRSRLDLQASQRIGTEKNRPFSFSTDNSNTRLRVALDLPLNRKRDRNLYRRSLISYNASIRGLQATEDNIKFNIRQQLRNLEQARVQYPIAVTQAVIAEELVLSTRLQLLLGMPAVRAPDLLFAYNDSREALQDIVGRRIGYIIERARFALELEAMLLDDAGFWPEVNDPQYQPQPNFVFPWNAGSAYGDFPSFLKVSPEYRRMLDYPPPGAPANPDAASPTED